MPALKHHSEGETFAWCRGRRAQDVAHFTPRSKGAGGRFLAQQLALEFDDVDRNVIGWEEVCFVQCLCVPPSQCHDMVSVAPRIRLLAGAGAPSRRVKAPAGRRGCRTTVAWEQSRY